MREGGLVAAFVAVILAAGCTDPPVSSRARGVSPRRDASTPAVPPTPEHYVGVVVAGETVDVATKVLGTLRAVHVRPGDTVEVGEPIATLDDTLAREELSMISASLGAAKARLRQAEIDARKARRDHGRARSLVDAGHAPRATLQDADAERARTEAAVDEARAEVSSLQAGLQQRRRQLDETTLVAPFSGTVAERVAGVGTVVAAGTPIVRLLGDESLWLRFAVPPRDVHRLAVGDVVRAQIETAEEPVDATIQRVAPEVDPAGRLVFIDARLEHAQGRIASQAGAAATVMAPLAPPAAGPVARRRR